MRFKVLTICIVLVLLLILPTFALGFDWEGLRSSATGFLKDIVIEKLFSVGGVGGVLAAILVGKLFSDSNKFKRAMKETGEFFKVVGTSMEDGSITGKEIGRIFKEGKDVIDLRRKTPAKYRQ